MAVFVLEMCFYAYRTIQSPDRQKIRKRLRTFSSDAFENNIPEITRKRLLSDVPLLNRMLLQIPGLKRLDILLQQANVQYPLGFFILLSAALALTGYIGSALITQSLFFCGMAAISLGAFPLLNVRLKKKKRMDKFERQLPEALDLIARALRAGHAFTSGMKLAADEFEDPLGPEFREALDEINFGVSVSDALRNLASRIDCPDLKYFVVSVIVQRETGGNLAEIIESIGHLIRERFKLQGKIRVLSAESRLGAVVLVAIPFVAVAVLRFMNPEYINILFSDRAGRIMVGIALFMMALGILFMKKLIRIRV
jgi:tight adherence protein B